LSEVSSSDKVLGAGSVSSKVPSLLLSGSERSATIPEKEMSLYYSQKTWLLLFILWLSGL
jgi:hypothetical protein